MIDKIEQESFPAFSIKDYRSVLRGLQKHGLKKLDKVVNSLHSKDLSHHDKEVIRKYVIQLMKKIDTLSEGYATMKLMLEADFNQELTEEAVQFYTHNGYDPKKDEFNHLPLPEGIEKS